MKFTPLNDIHISLGAKMAEFAGYNMPISYSGIKEEHFAVRNAMGIFDVSHMGEFIVKGKEALNLVQLVTSNDASKLQSGNIQYSCLPNGQGGIVDDLLVYRLGEEMCAEGEQAFLLVVNASNMKKDWDWISKHNTFDTRLINISEQTALLAVQGPKVVEALQSLTDVDLASIEYYNFRKGTFAGVPNVLISATGYTGAGGFELYVENEHAAHLWNEVMRVGTPFDIKPAGLGARDTLRLEMGFCLYGNDIDDTTSPLEAGLGWITKLNKPSDFTDKAFMTNLKATGIAKKLVGFEMEGRRVPRHDMPITDATGAVIGKVTSGTQSPCLDKAIGMGYVESAFATAGSEICIDIRGGLEKAKVVKLPFYVK
jgi:aminomethyltransferase